MTLVSLDKEGLLNLIIDRLSPLSDKDAANLPKRPLVIIVGAGSAGCILRHVDVSAPKSLPLALIVQTPENVSLLPDLDSLFSDSVPRPNLFETLELTVPPTDMFVSVLLDTELVNKGMTRTPARNHTKKQSLPKNRIRVLRNTVYSHRGRR